MDDLKKQIWPQTIIKKRIPRQLSSTGKETKAFESVASAVQTVIVAATFVDVILKIVIQGPLNKMISALTNL